MESLLLEGLRRATAILMIAIQVPAAVVVFFCSVDAANLFGKEAHETTVFEKRRKYRFTIVGCISLGIFISAGKLFYILTGIHLFEIYFTYTIVVFLLTCYSLVTPK